MGILDRLLGRLKPRTETTLGSDPIRIYDSRGIEYLMSREEYRLNVLPGQFMTKDIGSLHQAVVGALQDGFFAEAVDPARRLLTLDVDRERSTTALGIALMRSGQVEEAQKLFETYLDEMGSSGVVLTNLAKVYSARAEESRAEETLWRAITVDANQDGALQWWGAIHYERGGDAAHLAAMERVAQLAGSWRAKLWLARDLLEKKKVAQALSLYQSILPAAKAFGDALMMISGDLANEGHLREALDLVGPHYDPSTHGIQPGLNLVKASIELGDLDRGRRFLAAVETLDRHDLIDHVRELRRRLE